MQLPNAIWASLEERAAAHSTHELLDAARSLSEGYRGGAIWSGGCRPLVYALTRMPGTYAAAHRVLEEVSSRLPGGTIRSALDLGAGTGAAALAALEIFPELHRLTLVERDAPFAELGRDLVGHPREVQVEWVARDLKTTVWELPSHDLVILNYSLGEFHRADASSLLSRAWQATQSVLVIVEPGTPVGYRTMLDARSRLLSTAARMIAPCPWSGPCPMAPGDWCHFNARVERRSLLRRLKQGALPFEDEKFSYVAVGRDPAPLPEGRLVRRPVHHPGLIELEVCEGERIARHRVTKRHKPLFRAARKARWGDPWPPAEHGEEASGDITGPDPAAGSTMAPS